MADNQGLRVQSIIDNYSFTNANTHNGYFMQMFDEEGIGAGDFNGRLIEYLQGTNSSSDDNINNLKQLEAVRLGFDSWGAITSLF